MVTWKVFNGTPSEWNSLSSTLVGWNMFQSYQWGEYKKGFGWRVVRLAGYEQDRPVLSIQAFVKPLPMSAAVVWVPGGLSGDLKYFNNNLSQALKTELGFKFIVIRLGFHRPHTNSDQELLKTQGFVPAKTKLTSGQTLWWNIKASLEELKQGLTPNWRHNLNRFEKRKLTVKRLSTQDIGTISALLGGMKDIKGIDSSHSFAELEALFKNFGDNFRVYLCTDQQGEPLAVRGAIYFNSTGWDTIAATNSLGRKNYASYGLLWFLISDLKSLGIDKYDLMGIDKLGNTGVYNFKKGTGALETQHLCEWDWTNLFPLRVLLNIYFKRKRNGI